MPQKPDHADVVVLTRPTHWRRSIRRLGKSRRASPGTSSTVPIRACAHLFHDTFGCQSPGTRVTEVSVAFTLKGLHSHTGHEPETSLRGGHVLPEGRGWREVVTEKAHAARGGGFLRQRRLPCDLRRSDSCTDVPGVWQPLGSGDRRGARGSRGEGPARPRCGRAVEAPRPSGNPETLRGRSR